MIMTKSAKFTIERLQNIIYDTSALTDEQLLVKYFNCDNHHEIFNVCLRNDHILYAKIGDP